MYLKTACHTQETPGQAEQSLVFCSRRKRPQEQGDIVKAVLMQ